jgi:hypothetical protein
MVQRVETPSDVALFKTQYFGFRGLEFRKFGVANLSV